MTTLLCRFIAPFVLLSVLPACAHTTNQALCSPDASGIADEACTWNPDFGYRLDPDHGYRFDPRKGKRRTLVVVTFSGGGIRAAALAYGTLLALEELKGATGAGTLLDDVDVISSVSGGSVTAGWYALRGKDGLLGDERQNALLQFLRTGGTGELAWRGLNPATLMGYVVTPYQRSDALSDFFAGRLFGNATYRDVETRYRNPQQPFVIVNATDLGHETRFPFTQNRFDLICSNLSRYKLADAVAASANFPIAFSAIGVRNFSFPGDCPARGPAWRTAGPPEWIDHYRGLYDSNDRAGKGTLSPHSNGLLQVRAAREAHDYVAPAADDRILHLLDGGLVDNLGIQSTLAIEDDAVCAPGLFQRLANPRPDGYRNFDEVLYIVVNARSRSPAGIDNAEYPPDVFSTLLRVIDTPLDSAILGTQNYLTAELQSIQRWVPSADYRPTPSRKRNCWREFRPSEAQSAPPFAS